MFVVIERLATLRIDLTHYRTAAACCPSKRNSVRISLRVLQARGGAADRTTLGRLIPVVASYVM